ncbi:MarR family transcriptional regulator [Domibacillus sp. DTU_2020_1001157_1_SI_ALB_TIR_016]|uniref:MarR family winged helix-turn-helix transcriptional regulator n=1 Tax=Domibacillus sp. DTU_2020_1001157_1_SI_ALB_TIR_016 TaxID=3077789 RepID=UPI0028E2598C|nr:MarR family transcriptional regulator [Domibacillus sp. DTU_2020_1001157_1_SI_ALB_TIR_016]WNS80614.1 MarR family transcriptional regulator [Domibacillus sp. DTU_2020_1001157_1_SI_ALB_TIR_016]
MEKQLREAVELFEEVIVYGTERILKSIDDPIVHEFSPEQIQMMKIIEKHGPITSGSLAVMQGVHKSAISNRMKKLEEKGLIQMVRSESDQRTKWVELTEEGREFIQKTRECVSDFISSLLSSHIDEQEVEQFVNMFRKLKEIIKIGEDHR